MPQAGLMHVFLEYIGACREFWRTAQRCSLALKLSPAQTTALQSALRKQALFTERHALRFEYLFSVHRIDIDPAISLDAIVESLDKIWGDADEAALKRGSPRYAELVTDIEQLSENQDPADLDFSLQQLTKNSQYQRARKRMAGRVEQLRDNLSRKEP